VEDDSLMEMMDKARDEQLQRRKRSRNRSRSSSRRVSSSPDEVSDRGNQNRSGYNQRSSESRNRNQNRSGYNQRSSESHNRSRSSSRRVTSSPGEVSDSRDWVLALSSDGNRSYFYNNRTEENTNMQPLGVGSLYFEIYRRSQIFNSKVENGSQSLITVPNLPGACLAHLRNAIYREFLSIEQFTFCVGSGGRSLATSQESSSSLQNFAAENWKGTNGQRDGTPDSPYKVNIECTALAEDESQSQR